jgi:hypothetical protein
MSVAIGLVFCVDRGAAIMAGAIPFLVCAFFGALLAVLELVRTFTKWIGRYWTNRYVLSLIGLNVFSAVGVYAFLRYALGVQNDIWLAIITGVTFPTILRSRFTFYRPIGKANEQLDTDSFSVTIDGWYRTLQDRCYEEINSQIAAANSEVQARLKKCLSESKMIETLEDHIAAEPISDKRVAHESLLAEVRTLKDAAPRKRRLAVLMTELMPGQKIQAILRACDQA